MPDPNCPHCRGTGYKIVERDELSAAEPCVCFGVRSLESAMQKAGIPPNYWHDSFDNFILPAPESNPIAYRGMAGPFTEVRGYAREFPATEKPGLLLVGDPGTGKTHLAVAVFKILLEKGHDGVFFDYQNLLERIKASYDANSGGSNRETYRDALESEVLLLDDLGAQRMTEWVVDTVTSLITYRCNHRLALIATTNLPDPEMGSPATGGATLAERIGARARSRLFEMCRIVRMPKVGDYRITHARS